MGTKKNFGPCSVANCIYRNVNFRLITELAYQKCQKENMLETYPYLEVGKQLCHLHYCEIVESDRNKKRKLKGQKGNRKKVANEKFLIEEEGNIIVLAVKFFDK